jgi:hypothetical protein
MALPWKRFWVPLGSEISCGISGQGFLDDPERTPVSLNNAARHLGNLLSERCLVLLGEPGLGKSTALEQAFPGICPPSDGDATTIWIRFRDIPDASVFIRRVLESPRWRSWLQGDYGLTLVLDGLDEGLIKIKDFLSFVTSEFRSSPVDRLRLITACRTTDWPTAAGHQLLSLWNADSSKCIWELCPLRWVDAELAATSFGVSADDFSEQLVAKNVVTLAARPTTLFFLLRQFKSTRRLEGGYREIYERGMIDLCREPDPIRAQANKLSGKNCRAPAPEAIRDGAALLAALLVFSRRSAISLADSQDSQFHADLCVSTILNNTKLESASREAIITSLGTALFSSRGEQRIGFAHQTFAECLAGRKVQNLPLIQLRKLFCGVDERAEHVIPQLTETAAWLAGTNDEFLEHLLSIDPGILLRSDVARIQGNRKQQIVRAILEKSRQLELFDDFGLSRFLSGLKHEQLAQQLWEYIQDDASNVIARRLALKIAEECKLAELNDALLHMLRPAALDQQVKEGAARVLVKTLANERLNELEPMTHGIWGPDPEDQLKGYALARLVPTYWSVRQCLTHISRPKDESFHGAYWSFLNYQCPSCIKVEDLPILLTWLTNVEACFDVLNPFCGLAYAGICLALRNLDQPEIRLLTMRLWKKDLYRQRSHRSKELEKLWEDQSIRQNLAFYLLQDPDTNEHDIVHLLSIEFPLLQGPDFGWLLERLPTIDESRLHIWVQAIWLLTICNDITQWWDLFLKTVSQIPALKSRFSLLRAWNLGEPIARKAKADYLRETRRRQRRLHHGITASDLQTRVQSDLDSISEGNPSNWVSLCYQLALKEGDRLYPPFLHHDIKEMPGWQALDDQQRALIEAAARGFLIGCSDDFEKLQARSTFSDPGYAAIWLLRDEFGSNEDLRRAVAEKWIHSIVGRLNDGEDHHQEMITLAYHLDQDATVDALRWEAEESFQRHGYILAWRPFGKCWDSRLSAVLAEFALSHSTRREALTTSFCHLFEYDAPAFKNWMRRMLPRISRLSSETRVTIVAIAFALAPAETWDLVWPLFQDRIFAEKAFLTIAGNLELGDRRRTINLAPEKLAQSVELLYQLFPPSAIEQKGGYVTPRQAVADYRRSMLDSLTLCLDPKAGEALLRLAKVFPDREIEFRWKYQDHLRVRRSQLWQPPSPVDLMAVLTRREARLVMNDKDLLEVVLESLERFEQYYTKNELPAVERLWHWQKEGHHRTSFEPKDEENLSDELARWLTDDIGPKAGIIVGREVQIQRGMKTDLLVKAVYPESGDSPGGLSTVVIEAKGCWNRRVKEDLEDQLVQKYLLPHNFAFGIYVVGWFICDVWKTGRNYLNSKNIEDAREEVGTLGDDASVRHAGLTVKGLVLDCRYR